MKLKIIFSIVLSIFAQQAYSQFGPGGRLCPPNQCTNCWTITFTNPSPPPCALVYYWHYPGTPNCGDVLAWQTTAPSPTTITGPCMSCMDGPCQCPSGLILGHLPYTGWPLLYLDLTDPSKFPTSGTYPFIVSQILSSPTCGIFTLTITVTGPYTAEIRIN